MLRLLKFLIDKYGKYKEERRERKRKLEEKAEILRKLETLSAKKHRESFN